MNVLDLIKNEKYNFYFNDNFINDNVRTIISLDIQIESYFAKVNFDNFSFDKYIDYIFLDVVSQFKQLSDAGNADYFKNLEYKIKWANQILKTIKIVNFINYIKNNYEQVYSNSMEMGHNGLYLRYLTVGYIIKYCKEDKNIILFILDKNPLVIISNFGDYKIIFRAQHSIVYFDELLKEKNFYNQHILNHPNLENVFSFLKKSDEKLFNEKVKLLCEVVERQYFAPNDEDIIKTVFQLRQIVILLKKLQVYQTYKFENEFKKQEMQMNKYLIENGKKFHFEDSLEDSINVFSDKNLPWETRVLSLTHIHTEHNKTKYISIFDNIILNVEENNLLNMVQTNIETDEVFGYSRINALNLNLYHSIKRMTTIMNKTSSITELFECMYTGVINYFNSVNADYSDDELYKYFNMLMNQVINSIDRNNDKDKKVELKFIYYGLIMMIFSFIEKIIRIIYYHEVREVKYVSENALSFSALLNSNEVRNVIGEGTASCFEYILVGRKGVGMNLRNDFAHLNSNTFDNLTMSNLYLSIFLLLTLSNTLLAISNKNSK